jgi:hypothetical protein
MDATSEKQQALLHKQGRIHGLDKLKTIVRKSFKNKNIVNTNF